ncbi:MULTISPECIES: hypothetical protein [unclassified Akkermansia]|uniref:hypothetical protein n=2 Tax=unclassified Akkermansia TaxID=2608915 RepID=UPI00122F8AD1|nr:MULTISPECIES: hypothetical protein [unclassified Akkermansia]KAA3181624.1 hypothetical protein F1989_01170 [Akkermansia sp. BIOML-A53]KAA3231782.1 hypothetical protein F1959_01190 [Akkermansia sp. BIOML-A36]KAA3265788.1 hypothetical protein F1939_01170 [Akkermansia sp. BIOML-A23]KAA3310744.1 hypothetical protein F1947_12820 [Akkermansia sp. BIOML-A1]KAA3278029.1 hypothetical protein F1946_01175 [Akkermansia sp. BIOML-A16]
MLRMLSGTSTSSSNSFLPLSPSASAGRASRYSFTTSLAFTSSTLPSFPKSPPFNTSGAEAPSTSFTVTGSAPACSRETTNEISPFILTH